MEWSKMLSEVLDIIAEKHIVVYEDYNSFAGVCKSWHSAAIEAASKAPYSNGPPSQFPCLMLSEKTDDGEFRELFLLSNKTIRKIRLPEVHGKLCMSSFGWLVTLGEDHATQLINPLSRETIHLPKIDTFPEFLEDSKWDAGIYKLLFLNQSSLAVAEAMVVVLWGCSIKLGFCRPGDNKWTHVQTGWRGSMCDITYYNGKVYSFDCNYHIRVCDLYGEDPTVMVDVARLPEDYYYHSVGLAYIIGLDGDDGRKRLVVVIRHGLYGGPDDEDKDDDDDDGFELFVESYQTESFKVFMYDLENNKWSKVNDFGTKSLFVGYNSTFWVEASAVIKGNCIYYTDDVSERYHLTKNGGGRDMGIFHLSDGAIEPHFTGESYSKLTPPIWLQPIY